MTVHEPHLQVTTEGDFGGSGGGQGSPPGLRNRYSPKVFTQPQLFACLVLMTFLRTDYRGVEAHLRDFGAYRQWLGLKSVPDHSTLHKAAQRIFGAQAARKLLSGSARLALGRRRVIRLAAADGTGLESGHRSPYFVRGCAKGQHGAKNPEFQALNYTRFPKLTILVDCQSHLILSLHATTGPAPDMHELPRLLGTLPQGLSILKLLLDAGFDSEENHGYIRDQHGILSVIPSTIGRPTRKPPIGRWRRWMRTLLRTQPRRRRCGYTQRWQVETVNSMVKRNLDDELFNRSYHARCRELRLLAITHKVMILLFW